MKKQIAFPMTGVIAIGLALSSCGKKKESSASEEEQRMGQVLSQGNSTSPGAGGSVPQVGSINLGNLGDESPSSLALNAEDANKCEDGPDMGIFGLALKGACHTAGFAAKVMLGSESGDNNGDGKIDCNDYTEGKNNGVMLGLMCGDFFKRYDGLKAFSFEDKAKSEMIALSFADFNAADSTNAAGFWTKGNEASYPANIRLWGSTTTFADLKGVFSANLTSLHSGEIQVDFEDKAKGESIRAASKFANNVDKKSGCEAAPSEENCVFQEIKIFNPDDVRSTEGAPNGMHIRIMTDDKSAPSFYIIEGRYTYRAEKAAGFGHGLNGTREIYLRVVQKTGQVWGQFNFLDANGADVATGSSGTDAALQELKSGTCKSTSEAGPNIACSVVDPAEFVSMWKGRSAMDAMATTPVTTDFSAGKPTRSELCLTDYPSCIDLSGR